MADKKQSQLTGDERQTMALLEEHIPKDALGKVPKEAKGFINSFLGMGARFINGFVGQKVSGAAVKFADWKYKDKEQDVRDTAKANYAVWGERIGRAAITSAVRIRPVFGIVKDYFKTNSTLKQQFAPVLRDGIGSWFGPDTELEAIRHMSDRNRKATGLRTRGFLQNFLSKLIPDLALNELEMRMNTLKGYYEEKSEQGKIDEYEESIRKYHHLNPPDAITVDQEQAALTRPQRENLKAARDALNRMRVAENKKGAVFADRRRDQTQRFDRWMNGQSWIPKEDGSGGEMLNMIAEGDPSFSGDFSGNQGRGRLKFLQYIKPRLTVLYETLTPVFLKGFAGDKYTPQATELLKQPCAGEMILDLEKFLKDNPSPVRVNIGKENVPLEDYVYKIFVQHRADMGRKPIKPDSAIDFQLREACEVIADTMTNPKRRMRALALIHLVDSRDGIWNIEGGALTGIKQDEALIDAIQSQIDDRGLTTRPRLKNGESAFVAAQIDKEAFAGSWNGLAEEERAAWSTFFMDELLLAAGEDKKQLRSYNRQDNDLCFDMMGVMLERIKKISQNELENEMGVDPKVVKQAFRLADGYRNDRQNYLMEHRAEAMQTLAIMGVQLDNHQPGFLSEVIQEARDRNHKIEGTARGEDAERDRGDRDSEKRKSFRENLEEERGEPGPSSGSKRIVETRPQREAHRRGEYDLDEVRENAR